MTLLAAALVLLAALVAAQHPRLAAAGGRRAAAVVVVLLPLAYAAAVLLPSRERLAAIRVTYVGKQMAWGPGSGVTLGGAAPGTSSASDLPFASPGLGRLRVESAGDETAERLEIAPGAPVLRLAAPSPVVRIDGETVNSYPVSEGDRVTLSAGGEALELELRDGALVRGERRFPLPGRLSRLLRGARRVYYLPDVLDVLVPGEDRAWPFRSLLHRPEALGPWHLLVRDEGVRVVRDGRTAGAFAEHHALPDAFELALQVARGDVLRTLRRDRFTTREGGVEVRFGEPQRRILRLAGRDRPFEVGLVVPSAAHPHRELIELAEPSPRFRGLRATLAVDPKRGPPTLDYLGDRRGLEPGRLYALGEGGDRLLVRVERHRFPRQVLVDLLLWALFAAVFLGPGLGRSAALAAVVGPAGLLLANRLLFAFRAAHGPPDFYLRGIGEARLALWVVTAALLAGWSLAWVLRQATPAGGVRPSLWPLRWPLAGLALAGVGALVSSRGLGNLWIPALLPWLAALVLALARVTSAGPRLAEGLPRLGRGEGPWSYRGLLAGLTALGLAILAGRSMAALAGMPEALRLPALEIRILWTVLQLPLAVVAFALVLERVSASRRQRDPRRRAADWLLGTAALAGFLVTAYLASAAVARDLGLLIVHALPLAFALTLLLAGPRAPARGGAGPRLAHGAGLVLVALPLLVWFGANLAPGRVAALVGWGAASEPGAGAPRAGAPDQVIDRAAALGSSRAQQLFRLYMLANPERLTEVGIQPAERVAIHYHTLQSYAEEAGLTGGGFASSWLPRHLAATYLNDLAPMVFVLADFGALGMLALALVYAALLAAVLPSASEGGGGAPLARQGGWLAAVALAALAIPSLYMILANLNLVLFTGKNAYLLALDSLSDVLESSALFALAALGLGLGRSA